MIRFFIFLSVVFFSNCAPQHETYYDGATRTLYIDSLGFPEMHYSIVELYCEGDEVGWTGIGTDIPHRALKLDTLIESTKCSDFIINVYIKDDKGHTHNYREKISKNNMASRIELMLMHE
jgi:hypothetical protein